ncbi:chromosome partitioning protein ParB (plasmid) [Pseudomonas sp. App30]|uniref:ParB family protein n=1 Tax=Pseudomonas sp. App30 TaxID=3068990 RepID=UPI003A80CB39
MKTPTCEEITRKLQHSHFPSTPGLEQPADPTCDTPMVVTLEQLRPYDHNPRFIRNPLYEELKASISERGLDQPPSITRRPHERHFIISNGGNTRLSILGELWQETRDERFFRISCLFRPWRSEAHALLGHLAESDLHGPLTFIERALAVAKARDLLQEDGNTLSQRELASRLSKDGYPISQPHISRMFDTLIHLLPAIPQRLYAGLGKHAIERVISLRSRAQATWNRLAVDVSGFGPLWVEVLSGFDEAIGELDVCGVQDALLDTMATALERSPRLLALELLQDQPIGVSVPGVAPSSLSPAPLPQPLTSPDSPDLEPHSVQHAERQVATTLDGHNPSPTSAAGSEQPDVDSGDALTSDTTSALRAPQQPPANRPASVGALTALANEHTDVDQLRNNCLALAAELASYAEARHLVEPSETGLGFVLCAQPAASLNTRGIGIQLILAALLRLHDDVNQEQRQQLPAALFGQLLTGIYDLPLQGRPALTQKLERLPDVQFEQALSLVRTSRRLIELLLSPAR